jgi:hypothetical protein
MNLDMLENSNMWEKSELVRLLKGAPGTQYQEASDTDKTIMRDWVKSLLNKQEITVKFIKADGTERDMRCTLNWDLIPKLDVASVDTSTGIVTESMKSSELKKPRKQPEPDVIKVYDLEAKAWRSFRMDRLKKITTELVFE